MLIVIVIIGILAAALIPRLWNARGRANDTARKATLSQVAAALVAHQIDKWFFPSGCGPLSSISTWLLTAWLDDIPKDPGWATAFWIDGNTIAWQYWYCSINKNSQPDWWFVIMAMAETEWWANYVVCSWNVIDSNSDFSNIQWQRCVRFVEWACDEIPDSNGECWYEAWAWQLRYIYIQ
jgi:type II secretory pathway pseudopilin PulG